MADATRSRRMRAAQVAALLGTASVGWTALPPSAWGQRERKEMARTSLEFHQGDLSAAEADDFGRLLDQGVANLEALLGPELPGGTARAGRVRFIVSRRVEISRCHGRTVFLPLARVRTRSAPYLHETVHALLPSAGDHVWLNEGLACYLESWVSENRGGYDAHVFTRAGDRGIHAEARRILETEAGRAVLPWVGARGEPPLMEEDRAGVARPFYVLSQSLTKHVVVAVGLRPVVGASSSADPESLRKLTGRSGESWKQEWLRSIGAPAAARALSSSVGSND